MIKTAVLKTRPGKSQEPTSVLHATWAAEAATVGWTPERLLEAARVVRRHPETPDRPLLTGAPTLAQTLEQVLPTPDRTPHNEPRTPEQDEQVALASLQAAGVLTAGRREDDGVILR